MQYTHSISGAPIQGIRLGPNVPLCETDVYDSTNGTWSPIPCPGLEIKPGCRTIIVRPDSNILKGHLWTMSGFDLRSSIGANGKLT